MSFRTDRNNNPTAFTTSVAKTAGLIENTDFSQGEPFTVAGVTYYTAKILGDPIDITIKAIDHCGFQTTYGSPRWAYIDLPKKVWDSLSKDLKVSIIGLMYHHEGGTEMEGLFK